MSITFLATSLLIVVMPGTGVLYVVSTGLTRGVRAALFAGLACTLGTLPHLILAVSGLAALLHATPVVFTVVTYLGVAYLIYLAWATWRDKTPLVTPPGATADATTSGPTAARVLRDGISMNLLNPKLTTFFLAFLPQFVRPDGPNPGLSMLGLGSIFVVLTAVVFAGYGIGAAAARERILTRPRVVQALRRIFALSFLALGAKLVLAGP